MQVLVVMTKIPFNKLDPAVALQIERLFSASAPVPKYNLERRWAIRKHTSVPANDGAVISMLKGWGDVSSHMTSDGMLMSTV